MRSKLVCAAPKVVANAKKATRLGRPFLTHKALPPDIEDEVLSRPVEEVIAQCCRGGGRRVPNLDIEGENVRVDSFTHGLELIIGALDDGKSFWTSLQADEEVVHPEWWRTDALVPTYTNILITQGLGAGIGLHVDVDNFGRRGAVIDTYLTLLFGTKLVALLPPNKVPAGVDSLAQFPDPISTSLLSEILQAGGNFFTLDATHRPVTLFIPRGWHHWLISSSAQTMAFTASTF